MKEYLGNDEKEIDPKDLAEILKLVDELEAIVKDSQLSSNLRYALIQNIFQMKSVISNYSIRGSRHFVANFSFNLSVLKICREDKETEYNSGIYKKLKEIFDKYVQVSSVVDTSCAIGSNLAKGISWFL